jgi:NAD(P)-dependent dehydrogenase (short-subunit alcohol dehydrogenase family)
MDELKGKRVLLTGAGSGIGRAILNRYLEEGARVCVIEIDTQKVDDLKRSYASDVIVVEGNVASPGVNEQAVQVAAQAFGGLDVFVGNAGIYDGAAHLMSMTPEALSKAFDEIFNVNVKGYLLGVRAAVSHLAAARGCVILTASYSSYGAAGGGALYVASKHAVLGVIRQLAYELAPKIRVNGVAPGVAPTVMTGLSTLGQGRIQAVLPGTETGLPLQFMPNPEDFSGAYVFLASERWSRMMTGSLLVADSGASIRGFVSPAGGMHL